MTNAVQRTDTNDSTLDNEAFMDDAIAERMESEHVIAKVVQNFTALNPELSNQQLLEALSPIIGHCSDLEQRLKEAILIGQTDALTGLYNRAGMDYHLEQKIASCHRRESGQLGVMLLDLDHFKALNDTHGHAAGDKALQIVAQRFKDKFRRDVDIVTRAGGDELVIIVEDMELDEEMLHRMVHEAMCEPTPITFWNERGGADIVGVSFGCAIVDAAELQAMEGSHAEKAERLSHMADLDMYLAKMYKDLRAEDLCARARSIRANGDHAPTPAAA